MASTCAACEASAMATCTVCRAALCQEHVQMGQPFISARQLVMTTTTTALRTPGLLSDLLLRELDRVPYCDDCRAELAAKRTSEQLKVLLGILLIMAIVLGLPMYLMFVG